MVKLLLATFLAPLGVLSQQAPNGSWGDILTAYGAAAPFALLCLWVINRQQGEIKELRAGMSETVPALLRANDRLSETTEALQGAAVMMHTLAGRGPDAETLMRHTELLRRVERALDDRGE